ncbi:MAG TPA: hypothetical protein VGR43_01255 [Dehalococcoidia bacterium]|jgi:hypothetical protein|nr:hypothetical protein [Dehalococcoidia bacterium]
MFLVPLLFPVLGVIAFLGAVWALLFVILRSHQAEISAEEQELKAKMEFMAKWHKDRPSKGGSRGLDVQVIQPKEPLASSNPNQADEVRSA